VFVGGLPRIPNYAPLETEMRRLFHEYEVQAVSKLISPHDSAVKDTTSSYFCYVDLPTPIDAQDAIQKLNGTSTPYGGTYKVRAARFHRGTNIVRREQLDATARVFVGALPQFTDREALQSHMRQIFAGFDVQHVGPLRETDLAECTFAEHRSHCIVELNSPQDARRAVDLLSNAVPPAPAANYKIRLARVSRASTTPGGSARNSGDWRARRGEQSSPPRDLSGNWREDNVRDCHNMTMLQALY